MRFNINFTVCFLEGKKKKPTKPNTGCVANENFSGLNLQNYSRNYKTLLQVNFGTALLWHSIAELQISKVQTKNVLNFAAYSIADDESPDANGSELWSAFQEQPKNLIAHPYPGLSHLPTEYLTALIGCLKKIVGDHEMEGNPMHTRQELQFWPIPIINPLNNLRKLLFWCKCL